VCEGENDCADGSDEKVADCKSKFFEIYVYTMIIFRLEGGGGGIVSSSSALSFSLNLPRTFISLHIVTFLLSQHERNIVVATRFSNRLVGCIKVRHICT